MLDRRLHREVGVQVERLLEKKPGRPPVPHVPSQHPAWLVLTVARGDVVPSPPVTFRTMRNAAKASAATGRYCPVTRHCGGWDSRRTGIQCDLPRRPFHFGLDLATNALALDDRGRRDQACGGGEAELSQSQSGRLLTSGGRRTHRIRTFLRSGKTRRSPLAKFSS